MSALAIGAGVLAGGSSLLGSSAQNEQLENQAQALERRSKAVTKEAAAQSLSIRKQSDVLEGQVTASAAGSGVAVNTGSIADLIEQNAFNMEMDALTVQQSAQSQADAMNKDAYASRQSKASGLEMLFGAAGSAFSAGTSAHSLSKAG